MAQTYKISKKQSLLDACIQVYGTAQLLFTLAKDNGLNIDSVVDIGDELLYDESLGIPKMKRALIRTAKDIANDGPIDISFKDWFLPSRGELEEMYTALKSFFVGDFTNDNYWSSSNNFAGSAIVISFFNGGAAGAAKGDEFSVRACRTFIDSVGAYALRDVGPAGGLIFYIDGETYYEAAPSDQSINYIWSNIDDALVATSDAIGTGQANTTAIIAQPGHTDSAAKLCNDLII